MHALAIQSKLGLQSFMKHSLALYIRLIAMFVLIYLNFSLCTLKTTQNTLQYKLTYGNKKTEARKYRRRKYNKINSKTFMVLTGNEEFRQEVGFFLLYERQCNLREVLIDLGNRRWLDPKPACCKTVCWEHLYILFIFLCSLS